jgi:tRNA threonylcarbamoyladenosine biosynthesis protein TsaE
VDQPVVSPTFVLVRQYEGLLPMFHADIYRLGSTAEIDDLELPAAASDGVLVVEWGDAAGPAFGEDHLLVRFTVEEDGARVLQLTPYGSWVGRPLAEVAG